MIELIAVGHLTHPACRMCRVCSAFPKISRGKLFKGASEKPYTSYTPT